MDTKHWSDDVYWIAALDRLHQLRDNGQTELTLDLTRIEEVAFREDGPAYKLMDAMCSVRDHERMDGFRGAPRIMLALLVCLEELSRHPR